MIPARLLGLEQYISFDPVKIEMDEGCEAPGLGSMQSLTETIFCDAHRSLRITPVAKGTSWGSSSWDESDSDFEAEIVGTIHKSDAPWFNVDERYVSCMPNIAYDEDTPLKFRPLMAKFVGKLRLGMANSLECEFLLTDADGTARHPEFSRLSRDVVFPVKRRSLMGSRPSDSTEF